MFKIGDTVRVKEDLQVNKQYNECWFTKGMEKYKGKEFVITNSYQTQIGDRYILEDISTFTFSCDMLTLVKQETEAVNHPSHYNQGIEAIDIIESWGLNFSLGNAIKYILRSPHKGKELEDLNKAKWYIEREIKRLEDIAKEQPLVL